jgi:hypothetical protein
VGVQPHVNGAAPRVLWAVSPGSGRESVAGAWNGSVRKNTATALRMTPKCLSHLWAVKDSDPLIKRPFRAKFDCRKTSQLVAVGRYQLAVTVIDSVVGAVG